MPGMTAPIGGRRLMAALYAAGNRLQNLGRLSRRSPHLIANGFGEVVANERY